MIGNEGFLIHSTGCTSIVPMQALINNFPCVDTNIKLRYSTSTLDEICHVKDRERGPSSLFPSTLSPL